MKKIIRICLTVLTAVLCCCSCNPYRKLEVRDARLSSISIFSNPASAVIGLEVYNPSSVKVEITEIQGTFKLGDREILHFTCDTLAFEKRCVTDTQVPIELSLAEGVGLMQILRIVQEADTDGMSADISVTTRGPLGISHRRKLVNLTKSDLHK